MGGKLSVDSEVGVGTTFKIIFNLKSREKKYQFQTPEDSAFE
jgi:hypothetical protein